MFKKEYKLFTQEVSMLKISTNPTITNLIDSGRLPKTNDDGKRTQYLMLVFAEKGDLFDYIYLPHNGLGERHGKLI